MTEQEIKRYGDMVRSLGATPFDPAPEWGTWRYYQERRGEFEARAVEAALRKQQREHEERIEGLLGEIYWCTTHLADASARLRNIEFKLNKKEQ